MNFVVRPANAKDASQLMELARQFSLLNLPAEKKLISKKIDRSMASFGGQLPIADAEYLFVVEDLEAKVVAGSSQIIAQAGTPAVPTYSFKILKKERFSKALGVGFIHQVLRLNITTDGPTELGGLVVDRAYRRRPEKIGRLASLCRLAYIGLFQDKFKPELHAEMAPPLTEEGRSEFWEALGRRFTGMPYQEADMLSSQNKEFIQSLFPEEDIYLCLLSSKARIVLGRVGEQTQPALNMLESIGFKYKNEVDPFDGGPHLGVGVKDVATIKKSRVLEVRKKSGDTLFGGSALVGLGEGMNFRSGISPHAVEDDKLYLPEKSMKILKISDGEKVFFSPLKN